VTNVLLPPTRPHLIAPGATIIWPTATGTAGVNNRTNARQVRQIGDTPAEVKIALITFAGIGCRHRWPPLSPAAVDGTCDARSTDILSFSREERSSIRRAIKIIYIRVWQASRAILDAIDIEARLTRFIFRRSGWDRRRWSRRGEAGTPCFISLVFAAL